MFFILACKIQSPAILVGLLLLRLIFSNQSPAQSNHTSRRGGDIVH